eukprot:TRINITY_DN7871_c0_g1_i1.p1 TRINITY_DN7871_c0_g1~~TRINITY_DN7871_c0_g1_i1.p1  ORF type:complete len:240 (-),score=62.77 TRINITY_DN7871_c0_g1_i1:33-752(-)
MGFVLWLGCVLVAYALPAVVFIMFVTKRQQLVIISIAAAFFWLFSVLVAALLWTAITPLQTVYGVVVPGFVVVQEIARYGFFKFYEKSERTFAVTSTNLVVFPLSDLSSSIAAGVGFAGIHGLIMYGGVLAQSIGIGSLVSTACPEMSLYVLSALSAFFIQNIQMALMVIAFDAFRRKSLLRMLIVWSLHMVSALVTLLNLSNHGCAGSLPILACMMLLSYFTAWRTIHQSDYRSKNRG